MTKGAALQQFFGRFMTAYASNAVPDDAVLPYLTYDAVFDAWGGGGIADGQHVVPYHERSGAQCKGT